MGMMADYHPDIIEFIISKMQNPKILQFIIETTKDHQIKAIAKNKLKFTPLTEEEKTIYTTAVVYSGSERVVNKAKQMLKVGGTYTVNDPDFLSGMNISVCLTKEFMDAIEKDSDYPLRFPDIENYSKEEMAIYNAEWHKVGDVREWEAMGHKVRTYRTIKARELWNLINICATYSAEPGIFFIDNANDMTNAKAYGQKVVATNPCGEQPLSPYAVCNLSAVNLANMVNKETKEVDYDLLRRTVEVGIRMQDNVISATPYFLEQNRTQALGERRIGMGVMGLADMLIYCEKKYGSPEGNDLVDKVLEVMATTAYRASIKIAREKGSFPFLEDELRAMYTMGTLMPVEHSRDLAKRKAFINTGFMKKMPEDIREDILHYGIRNSHLLTIAPTGSTGTLVGVSTGLEPYFSFKYYRSGRLGKFIEVNADIVQEYLDKNPEVTELPSFFIPAMELSPEAHADTQCVIQKWIDSSISKTVNAPKGYTVSQVEKIYERLHKGGAKGGTIYVDGSRDAQVLSLTNEENTFDDIEDHSEAPAQVVEETVTYGVEAGNTCPICRKGKVEELGGCTTCTNCKSQLKCGL